MRTALLCFLAGMASALVAAPKPQPLRFPPEEGCYRIAVYKVVDGDTVHFYYLVPGIARLHGINTPELKGATKEAGLAARDHLINLLAAQKRLDAYPIDAEVKGREKYGRTLLRLWTADGKDVSEEMIKTGQAKPYNP